MTKKATKPKVKKVKVKKSKIKNRLTSRFKLVGYSYAIHIKLSAEDYVAAQLVDLSMSGVGILSETKLKSDQKIAFTLDKNKRQYFQGQVKWCVLDKETKMYRSGLKLNITDSGQLAVLRDLVKDIFKFMNPEDLIITALDLFVSGIVVKAPYET